jgi:hypothetical protein
MKVLKFGEDKVNFVDKNNVFVGYDLSQDCCEDANWFISDIAEDAVYSENGYEKRKIENPEVEEYVFDTTYFKQIQPDELDKGEMVIFKLINMDKVLYLHLYNAHNGYYGHGFDAKIGDTSWQDGCL